MRLPWVLACTCAVATFATLVHADEPATHEARYALEVADPDPLATCGGVEALRAGVEARLRREVFTSAGADVELRVTIDAEWRAHIVERAAGGATGDRDVPLAAGDCTKSLDTLAVVLAIMIGPRRRVADAKPVPPPAPAPVPARAPPPLHAALPPPPPPRWRAGPVVEFAFGTGVLPHLAGGVQGGLLVEAPDRRLAFLARGLYWPARSTETAADAEVARIGLAAAACYAPIVLAFALSGCLGFEGGRLHSTSNALTRPAQNGTYLDTFVEARAGHVVFRNGSLGVEPLLAVQVDALVRRDRFTYESGRLTLLQPSPIAFQASFGVAVHFP